jgi:hypothetical protein
MSRSEVCWVCRRHVEACYCEEDSEQLRQMYEQEQSELALHRAWTLALGLSPDDFRVPDDDAALDAERGRGYEREQQLMDMARGD